MKIRELTKYLESLAPISSQESYDNSGLITGSAETELENVLICLDCTEDVIEEAVRKKCNLIISHHPVIFKGLKKLTGSNYVERTVLSAIKNNIALYGIHTNLDNYHKGVNKRIGELLGISHPSILSPVPGKLQKLIIYVPNSHLEQVANACFQAGAGNIGNYSECSFSSSGTGTFKGSADAKPFVGAIGERHFEPENKLEVLVSSHTSSRVIAAMLDAHPYEEVAYDLLPLANLNSHEGAGMYGELAHPITEKEFLGKLKEVFHIDCIKHTKLMDKPIQKVAWCGGSGAFLIQDAKRAGADIFITGDLKYHEFFDAENQIVIADIGHFESEQFTIELIRDLIQEKFPKFAPCLTETNTNPVKYF